MRRTLIVRSVAPLSQAKSLVATPFVGWLVLERLVQQQDNDDGRHDREEQVSTPRGGRSIGREGR